MNEAATIPEAEPQTGALPNVTVIDEEEYTLALKAAKKWRDFDTELDHLSSNVSQSLSAVVEAKAELKAAKANHELAVDRLQRAIAERHQTKMPFVKPEPAAQEAPAAADESWKDRPIRELELTPGILTKLEEMGIDTIGKLEHLRGGQDPDYPRGLLSVKGFGEAKITLIEDAVCTWLDRNRDNLHRLAAEEASPEPVNEAPPEDETEEQTEEEVAEEPDGDGEVISMGEPPAKSAARKAK